MESTLTFFKELLLRLKGKNPTWFNRIIVATGILGLLGGILQFGYASIFVGSLEWIPGFLIGLGTAGVTVSSTAVADPNAAGLPTTPVNVVETSDNK